MHLRDLLSVAAPSAPDSVPDWILGCFKRKSITFANGLTDLSTQVFWLQGRNQTIDLRLPVDSELIKAPWRDCSFEQLEVLADYEGWSADSHWQDGQLSWSGGVSYQLHNRWPEPAILNRVGNCMIELSPRATYVEDWRIQSIHPGALISLTLLDETDAQTGTQRHKGGALIIAGEWAGLVLGRAREGLSSECSGPLRQALRDCQHDQDALSELFGFEASIGWGNLEAGFTVLHSTSDARMGEPLLPLEGFEWVGDSNFVVHRFTQGGRPIERRYYVDAIEADVAFSSCTAWHPESEAWFERERGTLKRYTEIVR
ncbi:MAG: hypothetical protein AAGA91_12815 [Pseudomonadota bacterium]